MDDILNQFYHIVDELASQQCEHSAEAEFLLSRQSALKLEIVHRLGQDGWKLMDDLLDLSMCLEDIHDKALFRTAFCCGMSMRIS